MTPAASANTISASAHIAALADQCVKCGLCQPVCPTYRIARTEAESPRGRIAFAQALAGGRIAATATLTRHLDQCVACLSCERVCPSQVRYGELLVATRAWLHASEPRERGGRLFGFLLAHPRLLGLALRLARPLRGVLQGRILRPLWRRLRLERWMQELPRVAPAPAYPTPHVGTRRGRVGLFLGCVAATVDRDVHAAALRLLAALGYEVVVPRTQGCCGALPLHAGDAAGADRLAARLRETFARVRVDTVLVSASGCFGTLRDRVFVGTDIRVREIHEFLAGDPNLEALRFRPLGQRVALHTPCTQANVARAADAIERLLARIGQLETVKLPEEPRCCGAAGDYFLRHAALADALRDEKVHQVRASNPALLLTSNVGCRIFLENALRRGGTPIAVAHPLVLLARQLEN